MNPRLGAIHFSVTAAAFASGLWRGFWWQGVSLAVMKRT